MNSNGVNINVVENDSVNHYMKVAAKLSKKYNKKRNINELFLKPKSPLRRVVSYILNTLSIIVFCFCLLFCFSAVYNRVQNMPPSIAGYFCMRVSSGSMVNSGFDKGDGVIVRSVDVKTLKEGDIIAFYSDSTYINGIDYNLTKVSSNDIPKTKYSLTLKKFFGIQSKKVKTVASRNQMLVFHHIREVYQDASGKRYFKTYGSSNLKDKQGEVEDDNIIFDTNLVQEDLVIGIYNNSKTAKTIASVLNVVSTPFGMLVALSVPVIILIISLLLNSFRNVQLAFLENDVVEEKRKLTDEICVKNEIGYRMSTKTKYKVLAQAPEDKKLEYINLLWKTDNRPQNIRKYYLRKSIILRPMQKLRDVNRQCEQMFKDNVDPKKIAKFYMEEKAKIQEEEKRYNKMLRDISQKSKLENKTTALENGTAILKPKTANTKQVKGKADSTNTVVKAKTNAKPKTSAAKQSAKLPTNKTDKNNASATKTSTKQVSNSKKTTAANKKATTNTKANTNTNTTNSKKTAKKSSK